MGEIASRIVRGLMNMRPAAHAGEEALHEVKVVSHLEPKVSVVIPLYNEVTSIPLLQTKLGEAMAGLGVPYEIIVVDDGSRDGSFEKLKAWHEADPHLKVIRF